MPTFTDSIVALRFSAFDVKARHRKRSDLDAWSTKANILFSNSKGGRSFYIISYLLSNKEALNQPVFTDSTQVVLVTADVDDELRLVLQLKLSANPLYDKNRCPHVGKYPPR